MDVAGRGINNVVFQITWAEKCEGLLVNYLNIYLFMLLVN